MATQEITTTTAEVQNEESFTIFAADASVTSCALTDLVPLDSTPIDNADYAMREINNEHVNHLLEAVDAGAELPPLKVVSTSMGFVVLDGYHRWATYESFVRSIVIASMKENGTLTAEGPSVEDYDKVRSTYEVQIETVTVESEYEMLKIAFSANLQHGLPATTQSRSRYALWLVQMSRQEGQPISIREAARQAQVSHVAVLKTAKKIAAKKNQKMVDAEFLDENAEELDELDGETKDASQTRLDKTDKAIRSLLAAIDVIANDPMAQSELTTLLRGYAGKVTKPEVELGLHILEVLHSIVPEVKEEKVAAPKKAAKAPKAKTAKVIAPSMPTAQEFGEHAAMLASGSAATGYAHETAAREAGHNS